MGIFDICGSNAGRKSSDPDIVRAGVRFDNEIAEIRRFHREMVTNITAQTDKLLQQQQDLLNGLRANIRQWLDAEINQQRRSLVTIRDSIAAQSYVSMDEMLLGLQMQGFPVRRDLPPDTNVTTQQEGSNVVATQTTNGSGAAYRPGAVGSAGTVPERRRQDNGAMERIDSESFAPRPNPGRGNANPVGAFNAVDPGPFPPVAPANNPFGNGPVSGNGFAASLPDFPGIDPDRGPLGAYYVWGNPETCQWTITHTAVLPFPPPWMSLKKYATLPEAMQRGVTWEVECKENQGEEGSEPTIPPVVAPLPPVLPPEIPQIPPTTTPIVTIPPLPPFPGQGGVTLPLPVPGCPGANLAVHCPACQTPVIQNYITVPASSTGSPGVQPGQPDNNPVGIEQPLAFRFQQRTQPWFRDAVTWGGEDTQRFVNSGTYAEYVEQVMGQLSRELGA